MTADAVTLDRLGFEKPLPSEIDVFGVTHTGRVRDSNADHFLVASFYRAMQVHASSMPRDAFTPLSTYSRGYLFLVADGVGAFARAAEGSGQAIQLVARYILDMAEISLHAEPSREQEVVERLRASVEQAHAKLLELGEVGSGEANATTLTMWIAIWPRAFVIHAGDSRGYRLRGGVLTRLTTDQTMAEAMVQSGAMSRESAEASRLKHVLLSALGSQRMELQVTCLDSERADIVLLCTDGLTRHVSEEEIRDRVGRRESAEAICRGLVDLALERGGEDNITVVLGKLRDV